MRRKNLIRKTRTIKTAKSCIFKYQEINGNVSLRRLPDQIRFNFTVSPLLGKILIYSFKNFYVWLSKSLKNFNLRLCKVAFKALARYRSLYIKNRHSVGNL